MWFTYPDFRAGKRGRDIVRGGRGCEAVTAPLPSFR